MEGSRGRRIDQGQGSRADRGAHPEKSSRSAAGSGSRTWPRQLVRRTKRRKGARWHTETVYAVASFTAERIQGTELLSTLRRHWAIEYELHWVRDVTFGEDASCLRTATGPAMMAALPDLAISLALLVGAPKVAAWTRSNARNPARPIRTPQPPTTLPRPGSAVAWVDVLDREQVELDGTLIPTT